MERAEYHRHSRARMAETAKDASRRPAPDAPERIDHRRRCTRHDHRTCCRGSRGSASLPCHTLRKRVSPRSHDTLIRRPADTLPLPAAPIQDALCLTNVYFGQQSGRERLQSRRLCLTKLSLDSRQTDGRPRIPTDLSGTFNRVQKSFLAGLQLYDQQTK